MDPAGGGLPFSEMYLKRQDRLSNPQAGCTPIPITLLIGSASEAQAKLEGQVRPVTGRFDRGEIGDGFAVRRPSDLLKRRPDQTIGYVAPPAGNTSTLALPGNFRRVIVHISSSVPANSTVGALVANSAGIDGA